MELVKLAIHYAAPEVSGRAFKVLSVMALTALDKPNGQGHPARLYRAGEAPLARVLGYGMEPSTNALREVRRVLRELRDLGFIEPTIDHAKRGTRQGYVITVGTKGGEIAHPNDADPEGENAHPNGGEIPHPLEGEKAPQRVGKMPTPRKEVGSTKDSAQDISLPHQPKPQTARGEDDDPGLIAHKFVGTPGADCHVCDRSYLDRTAHPLRLLHGA